MKIWKKYVRSTLAGVLAMAAMLALNVVMNGIRLAGVPKDYNVSSVTVSFQDAFLNETKETSDQEDISMACMLPGSGNYAPFREPEGGEPIVTIVYHLTDGRDMVFRCNETTVWWNGAVHALKQKGVVVNLTEGVFFFGEAVESKGY